MQGSNETGSDPTMVAAAIGVVAGLSAVAVLLVEWPVLMWSTLLGRPTLMERMSRSSWKFVTAVPV